LEAPLYQYSKHINKKKIKINPAAHYIGAVGLYRRKSCVGSFIVTLTEYPHEVLTKTISMVSVDLIVSEHEFLVTLLHCALSCGTVYCNRSRLFVGVWVGLLP